MRVCREGRVMVMFPEGTRRAKGLHKKHQPLCDMKPQCFALWHCSEELRGVWSLISRTSGFLQLRFGPEVLGDVLRGEARPNPLRRRAPLVVKGAVRAGHDQVR